MGVGPSFWEIQGGGGGTVHIVRWSWRRGFWQHIERPSMVRSTLPLIYDTVGHTRTQAIYGLLPYSGRVHWVSSGGLIGVGDNAHKPPDPLFAKPRAGNVNGFVGREHPSLPLPIILHVRTLVGFEPPPPFDGPL